LTALLSDKQLATPKIAHHVPLDRARILTRACIYLKINKMKLLMKIVKILIKRNWCFGHALGDARHRGGNFMNGGK